MINSDIFRDIPSVEWAWAYTNNHGVPQIDNEDLTYDGLDLTVKHKGFDYYNGMAVLFVSSVGECVGFLYRDEKTNNTFILSDNIDYVGNNVGNSIKLKYGVKYSYQIGSYDNNMKYNTGDYFFFPLGREITSILLGNISATINIEDNTLLNNLSFKKLNSF